MSPLKLVIKELIVQEGQFPGDPFHRYCCKLSICCDLYPEQSQ